MSSPRTISLALVSLGVLLQGPATAAAQGTLTASFDTTEAGGNYAPRNIVAAWIEDTNGAFVRTIGRWADRRIDHLVAWSTASGQDVDAVSGATRADHSQRLTVTWNMTDTTGATVPNGDYVLRLELADRNSSTPDQNNQASFAIVVDGVDSSQTVSGGGFLNVAIDIAYAPPANPADCGNDVVDSGETCDPVGSCPTSCAPSTDACITTALTGSAATCTAACVETTITACVDGDGCCASGCTSDTDDDCAPGGEGAADDFGPLTGGCSTGGHGPTGGLLVLLCALALAMVRRRA